MSVVAVAFTAPQGDIWQLLAGITPFAMALMQSFLQLDSEVTSEPTFLHPSRLT
jgi:hypothetical protein